KDYIYILCELFQMTNINKSLPYIELLIFCNVSGNFIRKIKIVNNMLQNHICNNIYQTIQPIICESREEIYMICKSNSHEKYIINLYDVCDGTNIFNFVIPEKYRNKNSYHAITSFENNVYLFDHNIFNNFLNNNNTIIHSFNIIDKSYNNFELYLNYDEMDEY